MRIVTSAILASFMTLTHSERAETSEDVPLMQATHLSQLSTESEESNVPRLSEQSDEDDASKRRPKLSEDAARWYGYGGYLSEQGGYGGYGYGRLLEDKELALTQEQKITLARLAEDEAKHYGYYLSEEQAKRYHYLLEDKELALTQQQKEVMLAEDAAKRGGLFYKLSEQEAKRGGLFYKLSEQEAKRFGYGFAPTHYGYGYRAMERPIIPKYLALLEDKELALTQEQKMTLARLAEDEAKHYGYYLSEEQAKRYHYLLEDKELALTQQQKEVMLAEDAAKRGGYGYYLSEQEAERFGYGFAPFHYGYGYRAMDRPIIPKYLALLEDKELALTQEQKITLARLSEDEANYYPYGYGYPMHAWGPPGMHGYYGFGYPVSYGFGGAGAGTAAATANTDDKSEKSDEKSNGDKSDTDADTDTSTKTKTTGSTIEEIKKKH